MSLINQPEVFGAKLISNLCLTAQLQRLIPEEFTAFFDGQLQFPDNDPCGNEIEALDDILAKVQSFLLPEYLDNFRA